MKLKCLIVDDEPAGRKILEEYVLDTQFLELVGIAEDPIEAMEIMKHQDIDLIYLDIQMPKINGIDFIKMLKNPPIIILTTAFGEYALNGFELDVLDYLLKPISFDRFLKATNKAREITDIRRKEPTSDDYFFVKSNGKYEKVKFDDLLFAEAANNYVLLQTSDRRLITYLTFKGIEESLPPDLFIRVHKSFMVSLSKIESLDGEEIRIGTHSIPISRSMKDEVMERIVHNRLLKR